jgi:hypothetical protein
MMDLIRREPALVRAAIMAAVVLLIAFGVEVSDTQVDSLEAFIVAVLALITAGVATRQRVTPYPVDPEVLRKPGAIQATDDDRTR